MLRLFCTLLTIFSTQPIHAASIVKGRVHSGQANPSYLFESKVTKEGDRTKVVSAYTDLSGKPLVTEETQFTGGKLHSYVYRQLQMEEHGEAKVEGEKVLFSFTNYKGTSTGEEDRSENLVVGPMIGGLIERNWDALERGESVRIRYPVVERQETVGFKFFKVGERQLRGQDVVDIKMKPSSFIIAALVSPIRITVQKKPPHGILEIEGRTPIREPEKENPTSRKDYAAIDARTEYDAPVELTETKSKPAPRKKNRAGRPR